MSQNLDYKRYSSLDDSKNTELFIKYTVVFGILANIGQGLLSDYCSFLQLEQLHSMEFWLWILSLKIHDFEPF